MKNQWHISQRHSSTLIRTFIPTWSQLLPYSWQCQCQLLPPNYLLEWCAQWRRTYDENRATRSLALMHVYRDIPIDVKALIRRFCAKKKGRLAVEFLWVPPRFQMFAKLTYAKPVACKKAIKNKFVLSSARDLQTSNIIFTVGANR